jgi:hypothetical protein
VRVRDNEPNNEMLGRVRVANDEAWNKKGVSGQTEERVRRKKEISFFTTLLSFSNYKSVLYI